VRIEQVLYLRARKIWIDDQPGAAAKQLLVAGGFETIADGCRDPALPHNRIANGTARVALPQHRGLPLIGDADSGEIRRDDAGAGDGIACGLQLCLPDRFGIVLDVTRTRKQLWKFLLRRRHDGAAPIEHDGAARCRPLIEGKHKPAHRASTDGGTFG
jgi:hypothetical protein